ncbi:MAG: proline racemase family protein [Rhizobiaceae bacterium]
MPDLLARILDSHTEGEPTRLVLEGGPDLGSGPMALRRERFASHHDDFRRLLTCEPRAHEATVGALLCDPHDPSCTAGLIFFNNVGYLGMCGHATIGAAVSLAHLGHIGLGVHRFETPVGIVSVTLSDRNRATIVNVESYRHLKDVSLNVPGLGVITGDVAWGGNWFFLTEDLPCELEMPNTGQLVEAGRRVRDALAAAGICGDDGAPVDHVEFSSPRAGIGANSRNFVLCPGNAWDRSPCGTGTSAKLACLAASGHLDPEMAWIQESMLGGRFEARYRQGKQSRIIPEITGQAWIIARGELYRDDGDPLAA